MPKQQQEKSGDCGSETKLLPENVDGGFGDILNDEITFSLSY